jgi:hypothetical protein
MKASTNKTKKKRGKDYCSKRISKKVFTNRRDHYFEYILSITFQKLLAGTHERRKKKKKKRKKRERRKDSEAGRLTNLEIGGTRKV